MFWKGLFKMSDYFLKGLTIYQTIKFWTGPNPTQIQIYTKWRWLKNFKFVLRRAENIFGKGKYAGYQYFLLFPKCFQKASSLMIVECQDSVVES